MSHRTAITSERNKFTVCMLLLNCTTYYNNAAKWHKNATPTHWICNIIWFPGNDFTNQYGSIDIKAFPLERQQKRQRPTLYCRKFVINRTNTVKLPSLCWWSWRSTFPFFFMTNGRMTEIRFDQYAECAHMFMANRVGLCVRIISTATSNYLVN